MKRKSIMRLSPWDVCLCVGDSQAQNPACMTNPFPFTRSLKVKNYEAALHMKNGYYEILSYVKLVGNYLYGSEFKR